MTIFVLTRTAVDRYEPETLTDAVFICHQAADDGHVAVDQHGREVLPAQLNDNGGSW